MKKLRLRMGTAAGIAGLLLSLSGCATLSNALNQMNNELSTGLSNAMTSPKLNFYVLYAITGVFAAYSPQGATYKQGQGTVWKITDTNGGTTNTSTIERALLKKDSDGTEWWRLSVTSSDGNFLYEYLVEPDQTIDKVRYKDPDTGKIEEFVPDKSKEQQSQQQQPPAQASGTGSNGSSSNGDQVTVKKDRQTITVEAGTFNTEHVTYVDKTANYRDESWTSNEVPGGLVKYVDTNTETNDVNKGELTKVESGIGTVLNSF